MNLQQCVFTVCLLVHLMTGFGSSTTIEVDNGGSWGAWGEVKSCPLGSYAYGFSLKVEGPQGGGDDTALNGIQLHCRNKNGHTSSVKSEMSWGDWTTSQYCPGYAWLTSFQLRVEGWQGDGDDTAANNIRFRCSNGSVRKGLGLDWGDWGSWSGECPHGISSMMTRLEEPQGGNGDDTALNDVQMFCCDLCIPLNN